MNKLEEIADKLKEHKYLMANGKVLDQPRFSRLLNSFPFDIEYLLQQLEIAQKALEDVSSLYSVFDDESTGMKGTADEALDKLKE